MQLYYDHDADLSILEGQTIAVIGYGNQGRAQALNLRDSGLSVIVGNQEDQYAARAREDGFSVQSITEAAGEADLVMLLIPDEVMPAVFEAEIAPQIETGDTLVFASGYNVAFDLIHPPNDVDVILVAPRMIGAGVRDLYVAGHGFPSFVGVEQDHTGQAFSTALALAKGIGSTRAGVVEVTFVQEAELDLFTEQCFGPAFGNVLTTAVDLLLQEGYPPAAVLLELYMSGELSYTLGKIAELGLVEQGQLHSRTSQYGSMSRGMRFQLPGLRDRMREGLEEIRSGAFAREWAAEQEEGCPTLEMLRESARSLPLYELEAELREALQDWSSQSTSPPPIPSRGGERGSHAVHASRRDQERGPGLIGQGLAALRDLGSRRGLTDRGEREPEASPSTEPLSEEEMERVLRTFVDLAPEDAALQEFAEGRQLNTQYVLSDQDLAFYLGFQNGTVIAGIGAPPSTAEVRLEMDADVLDAMFTGRINAARAAMSGKISFHGDARRAMTVQRVQKDLTRLYQEARGRATASSPPP
jgi:ketol-acid reductoisomerase